MVHSFAVISRSFLYFVKRTGKISGCRPVCHTSFCLQEKLERTAYFVCCADPVCSDDLGECAVSFMERISRRKAGNIRTAFSADGQICGELWK